MPFGHITHNLNPRLRELEERLYQEWQHPESKAPEPVIIEEHELREPASHLYVVWSEWRDISQVERSRIILRAFERRYDRNSALHVTLAMGVTQEEAKHMGIEYAALEPVA